MTRPSDPAGNSVSAFASRGQESKLTQLVAGIEAALQRFHKKPLGPIGSLLTLTDDRWAIAVEASIGKIFGNFIVHDQHDANLIRVSTFCPTHTLACEIVNAATTIRKQRKCFMSSPQ